MGKEALLTIRHVQKGFPVGEQELAVLENISIEVEAGKILCLLGYSGCGKTTLLRIIAGLETAGSGEILVEGTAHTIPSKDVLLLFQDFNQLFPWKTVRKNIMHSLLITKTAGDKKQAAELAEMVLREVGLTEFADCYLHQLSGGMKQRAAVARALSLQPKILLLDEPFASLDMVTRHNLQKIVREKCMKFGITVVFVTHGVEEAVLIGDNIVIMESNPGRIGMQLKNRYILSGDSVDKMKMMSIIMEQLNSQIEQEAEK